MKTSRIKNVLHNMWEGTFFQIVSFIMGFVSRTIFIRILSAEYLGINSLFTNILTILSFAELGIGHAIIFNLYKPIKENDEKKINALLNFYKRVYFLIGLVIIVVGIILTPFLPNLISKMPNIDENIYLIYLMFLFDTAISYFFTYRLSIITADQKNYIVVRVTQCFKLIQIVVQMSILFLTHNYYLYLAIQLSNTLITFLYLSYKSKKMYPFTKKLGKENVSKTEKNKIFKNVKALFINKFSSVILNGTDSIIISKYIGIYILGLYSNYLLIISAITQVLSQLLNSFTASIGNLNTEKEIEKKEKIFNMLYYFTILIFGVIGICLYVLFNDFITIWLGESYLLSKLTVGAIVLHFYVNGVQFSTFTYRQTAGLFREYKYFPILAVILNISLSIILAKYIGIAGVFFATSISRLATAGWIDPIVVFKNVFKKKSISYFIKYLYYIIVVLISLTITSLISNIINASDIKLFIAKGFITFIAASLCIILFTLKTKEFREIYNLVKEFINNFLKRNRSNHEENNNI